VYNMLAVNSVSFVHVIEHLSSVLGL